MTTPLVKNPLRTSLSMLSGHEFTAPLPTDSASQPLAYIYATWEPGTADEATQELGYYDEDAQVWVSPHGITMGVPTKTRTSGSGCGDCVTDDACF